MKIQDDKNNNNMHCPCLCKMFWFLTGQNILKISEHYHKLSKAVSNHKTNLKCMQRRSSACGVVVGGLLVVHRGA